MDMRTAVHFCGQPSWHSVAGRHIFADNAGQVQAQIGFLTHVWQDWKSVLEQLGHAEVEVRLSDRGPISLTAAGLALAERYQVNTALTAPLPTTSIPHLVLEGAGSPFLVLVKRNWSDSPPEGGSAFSGHPQLREQAYSWTGQVGDQILDVWMLSMDRRPPGTRMAVVRNLCCIVGWLQELTILDRFVAGPDRQYVDNVLVEAFVRNRAGKLRRKSYEGWPIEPILARVTMQSAARDEERMNFERSVRPLLSAEVGNDILSTLRRVDLHRDALDLRAAGHESDPIAFVEAARSIEGRAARASQRNQGEMPDVVTELKEQATAVAKQFLLLIEEIRAVHALLVAAGLADRREALFAGIDRGLIAGLPKDSRPDAQLLSDLTQLNWRGVSAGPKPPLAEILRNAAQLMRAAEPNKAEKLLMLAAKADEAEKAAADDVRKINS